MRERHGHTRGKKPLHVCVRRAKVEAKGWHERVVQEKANEPVKKGSGYTAGTVGGGALLLYRGPSTHFRSSTKPDKANHASRVRFFLVVRAKGRQITSSEEPKITLENDYCFGIWRADHDPRERYLAAAGLDRRSANRTNWQQTKDDRWR